MMQWVSNNWASYAPRWIEQGSPSVGGGYTGNGSEWAVKQDDRLQKDDECVFAFIKEFMRHI